MTARDDLAEALKMAQTRYAAQNPKSAALMERAARVLPGGNTRSSLWNDPFPLRIVAGRDCRITDADGHDYVDFLGEFTQGIAGHSHPVLVAAVRDAAGRGMNLSAHTETEILLAEALCARIPSFELVRFTNSGTEANMMALALARAATGRHKIIVFKGAYHGAVLAFSPAGAAVRMPYDFVELPYNDVEAVRHAARTHEADLAAIIVEPMLGAGGCIPAQPDFLRALRMIADECGALLIFDEVQTARLALGGMQEKLGVTPDLTTIGKFFGGGLPFGAFGGGERLMRRFDPREPGALMHAGTFNNNSLTMAAGLAAVTEVVTATMLDALNARGENFRSALNTAFADAGAPFVATGLGSIMNIHPRFQDAEDGRRAMQLLFLEFLSQGIFIAQRGLMALSLPIGEDEIDAFLRTLARILSRNRALTPGK